MDYYDDDDFDLSGIDLAGLEYEADLAGLSGWFKKFRKRLKKFTKSKVFKAAVVIGAGAVAYSYAAPALKKAYSQGKFKKIKGALNKAKKKILKANKAKSFKQLAIKKVKAKAKKAFTQMQKDIAYGKAEQKDYANAGKKLIDRGTQLANQPLPKIPPTPAPIKRQLNKTIAASHKLPEPERQKYIVESPAFKAKAEFKARAAVKPVLYQGYIDEGIPSKIAAKKADKESKFIADNVTQNFVQKSQESSGNSGLTKLAIPAGLLAMFMLK